MGRGGEQKPRPTFPLLCSPLCCQAADAAELKLPAGCLGAGTHAVINQGSPQQCSNTGKRTKATRCTS